MLEADHHVLLAQIQELRDIFQKWRRQAPGSWSAREKRLVQTWFRKHRLHLGTHFKAEEAMIFPYLTRQVPRLGPVLAKLEREHREIRRQSLAVETAFHALCNPGRNGQTGAPFCQKSLAMLRLIHRHVSQEARLMESAF